MNISDILHITPFDGLSEDDLVSLIFGAPNSVKQYRTGEIIATQGKLCRGLYILSSGSVRATMIGDDGKEITIEEIKAPNLLASAFIFATENKFPVNVEAMSDSEVCWISKERFLAFMQTHASVLQSYLTHISDISVFLSRKINEFALQNLKMRILKYLETHPDIHNQREVAQRLGVTRPSLARALAELANEGKIKK